MLLMEHLYDPFDALMFSRYDMPGKDFLHRGWGPLGPPIWVMHFLGERGVSCGLQCIWQDLWSPNVPVQCKRQEHNKGTRRCVFENVGLTNYSFLYNNILMSDLKVILIFRDKIQAYILNNNLRAARIAIVLSYKKDLLSVFLQYAYKSVLHYAMLDVVLK